MSTDGPPFKIMFLFLLYKITRMLFREIAKLEPKYTDARTLQILAIAQPHDSAILMCRRQLCLPVMINRQTESFRLMILRHLNRNATIRQPSNGRKQAAKTYIHHPSTYPHPCGCDCINRQQQKDYWDVCWYRPLDKQYYRHVKQILVQHMSMDVRKY